MPRGLVLALLAGAALPVAAQEAAGPPPAQAEPPPIQAGRAPPPGPYAPGVDVLHYELEVGLGLDADWFAGRADIRVLLTDDVQLLPLDFTGLAVDRLLVDGIPVQATHAAGILRVPLDAGAGDTVLVSVDYRGVPDDGLILRDNVHGQPSAFVDNWPNRARFWFPSVDHPADKATVGYTVHAPAGWDVIANGVLLAEPAPTPATAPGPAGVDRRTWRWRVTVPISTYNMVVGAADMEIRSVGTAACGQAPASQRDDGCVEVSWWAYPQDTAHAARVFRRGAEMVEYFTETVGPFPFEKLAHVQSATRFGGMENASAIFYSEAALAEGRDIEGTVSHETAHQWFGDAVTEADWHHLWLSEGFATYFGALFFQAADGEEAFRAILEANRQRYLSSDVVDRPIVDEGQDDLFALLNANNYPKGGWVLHMLRGVLGDEDFFRGIRLYYRRHLHQAVLTRDFQQAMEEASGRELEWFFRQWIHEPGYPVFRLEHRWEPGAGGGGTLEVTVRQVQKDAWPRFRMPVELVAVVDGVRHSREVEVTGDRDVFRIPLPARPGEVLLDPGARVLKELVR